MEKIVACRVCLSTDAKLYDIFAVSLSEIYENLVGVEMLQVASGLPDYVCGVCAVLLQKTAKLQQRVLTSREILLRAEKELLLSTHYIQTLDRKSYDLLLPFEITGTQYFFHIKDETCDGKVTSPDMVQVKRVKLEENSDEEPLAKIVKRRKKTGNNNRNYRKKDENFEVKDEAKQLADFVDSIDFTFEDCADSLFFDDDKVVGLLNDDDDIKPVIEQLSLKDDNMEDEIEIVELSKEEQKAEIEKRKTSLNYLNSTYKCEQCYKGFLVDTAYNNHMEKHDVSCGTYICDICHIRFKHKHLLHSHEINTHVRNYVCRRCGHISKSKIKAKEHYQWHIGVVYPCDVCGANFNKRTTLLTHVRIHHATSAVCDICQMCFVSQHGLKMHRRKTHRVATRLTQDTTEFQCLQCKVSFMNIEALNKHIGSAVDNTCDTTLRLCFLCGDGFRSAEELKVHVKKHQQKEMFECLECHKTFSNRRYYAAHFQRAHVRGGGAAPAGGGGGGAERGHVVCEVCGRKCKSKVTLVYHQRTHSGEKPYQCTECPKRFSVLQRLQYHVRTHTGERPCQCPYCPKAFRHKAALNRHQRVHTGAKPYVCQHCNKAFSQSNTLKGHVRTVHLKLPALYRKPNAVECE